jgi:hypothetical protein
MFRPEKRSIHRQERALLEQTELEEGGDARLRPGAATT